MQARARSTAPRGGGVSALPDPLRNALQELSGLNLSGVRVHWNSGRPARVGARAYAQATDVYLGPGHGSSLAHEAWHVVQQVQGRVEPRFFVEGLAVNDDSHLEREAERMGVKAERAAQSARTPVGLGAGTPMASDHLLGRSRDSTPSSVPERAQATIQRSLKVGTANYTRPTARATNELISRLEQLGALRRGWKKYVRSLAKGKKTHTFRSEQDLYRDLLARFSPTVSAKRPGFVMSAQKLGRASYSLQSGKDQSQLRPGPNNLALPHRFSYKAIRDNTQRFVDKRDTGRDLGRWSIRLKSATKRRWRRNRDHPYARQLLPKDYDRRVEAQLKAFDRALKALQGAKNPGMTSREVVEFIKVLNSLHGNIPDYGPHVGVNVQVADRLHLNILPDGSMSPGTEAALRMTPDRVRGYATTQQGGLITPDGRVLKLEQYGSMAKEVRELLKRHNPSKTSLRDKDLHKF